MTLNLCLGTVQFGINYGITNKIGKVSNKNVNSILESAFKNGIKFIDTAQAYGNSEEILGKSIKSKFKFI